MSVITVKRAYEELEREGIIFRRQGLGTFVAEQGRDRSREDETRGRAEFAPRRLPRSRRSRIETGGNSRTRP